MQIILSDSRWSKLSLSAHPEIIEELEDDQPEVLQTLTFDDLLSFAFQVAKGMEFLSSKNVRDTLNEVFKLSAIRVKAQVVILPVYPSRPGSSKHLGDQRQAGQDR